MPFDRSKYPADWRQIRARILEREGHACKWCRVKDRRWYEDGPDGQRWEVSESTALDGEEGTRVVRVVLTISHLDHDTANNLDGNLAALCQRCHLRHDARLHAGHAGETRRAKKQAGGQTTWIP